MSITKTGSYWIYLIFLNTSSALFNDSISSGVGGEFNFSINLFASILFNVV